MSFEKQRIQNYLLYDTPVENIFISQYMKIAPGDYIKVYLFGLMNTRAQVLNDNGEIAKALGLKKEDVEKAWDYWEKACLVKRSKAQDGLLEFVNIREEMFGRGSVNVPAAKAPKLDDKALSELLGNIERVSGRLLEAKEPEAVATWLYSFGMDGDLVLYAYKYCTENKSSNRYRYVETILKDWNNKGLVTVEKVKEFLLDTDKKFDFYKQVFRQLGFKRNPTAAEKEMMSTWMADGFGIDDVSRACKKTTGISNPNLNYINTILYSKKEGSEKSAAELEPIVASLSTFDEYYEKIREANERKSAAMREKLFVQIPRLREISDELRSLGYRMSRIMLGSLSGNLDEEKKKQAALRDEQTRLLLSEGYKADALEPIVTCRKCSDTGIRDDGTYCDCYSERLIQK